MVDAVDRNAEAVRTLGHDPVFLWLGKIFYGILYKELLLLADRANPTSGTILLAEDLERFRMHRLFLQQVRSRIKLHEFNAGSLFVFQMQRLPDCRMEWDLVDNVQTMFVGIRVGTVGLLAVLGDGGAQQLYEKRFESIRDLPLHPLQFRELCARVSYGSTLATRTPKYIIGPGNPHTVFQLPLGGLSAKPLFDEWDPEMYGRFLAHYTGQPFEQMFQPPNKTWTCLYDQNSNPRFLSFKDVPVMPREPAVESNQ